MFTGVIKIRENMMNDIQREILYRGKEIKTKRWVYGGFHEHKPSIVAIGKQPETEALIIEDGNADWNLPVPIKAYVVEKKTVGEYTGLTDKDGVRIFEGDIVKSPLPVGLHSNGRTKLEEQIAYVFYIDLAAAFWLAGENLPSPYHMYKTNPSKYKIIGNIHDTPELLERDKEVTP
jgi:uncharacterized phage protein (TIGR01671 family)